MSLARRAVPVALASLAAALPAQVPAHAVLLNPSGAPLEARLLRVGDTVHAVGYSVAAWGLNWIHYARSVDGGRTWPVRELPIAYTNLYTGFAAQGDLVVVLVYSQWFGPHTITSTDGGATWAVPVRVSQQAQPVGAQFLFDVPRFHLFAATVNVVWFEPRGGGAVWTNRSDDGGLTWQPVDTRLDVGVAAAASGRVGLLKVFGEGSTVHAIWPHETTSGWVTMHQRSLDSGATWWPVPQPVMNGSALLAAGSASNLLVVDSSTPTVLRSGDAGSTWSPVVGLPFKPVGLAVDGARVLAVGSAGQSPNVTILLDVSTDGGATWLPTPYTVPYDREFIAEPHLVGDAALVRFWFQANNASVARPGVVIQSDDDGVQWRLVDDEVWHGLWPSTDGYLGTTLTGYMGNSVYAYVIEGHTTLGQGTAGTGGFVPLLAGTGLPGLGRTFSLDVHGARGGSLGALFATFGATANVPLGTATLYLQQPIGPFGFVTTGASGVAGAGAASVPIAVPASSAFAGLRMASQAFVLDPGSPDGFAATRAIETWLR